MPRRRQRSAIFAADFETICRMKREQITVDYCVLEAQELSLGEKELVEAARAALCGSHADYSGYRVGAAVRLAGGRIVKGSNQENASSPCGICAERTALFYAQAEYPGERIEALAVATAGDGEPVSPCGLCRQALAEAEERQGTDIKLLLAGQSNIYIIGSAAALLPLGFGKKNLGER